jgi:hypothetical protein
MAFDRLSLLRAVPALVLLQPAMAYSRSNMNKIEEARVLTRQINDGLVAIFQKGSPRGFGMLGNISLISVEPTRAVLSDLDSLIDKLLVEINALVTKMQSILQAHQNTPALKASLLIKELKQNCDLRVFFANLTDALESIIVVAENAGDTELVDVLKTCVKEAFDIKKSWESKSDPSILRQLMSAMEKRR